MSCPTLPPPLRGTSLKEGGKKGCELLICTDTVKTYKGVISWKTTMY